MSTLAEPVPERLTADTVNARWAAGAERAAALEPRLVRQYEASLRATARRCVAAYRARTQVLTAAMPPKPEGDPTNISQPPQPTVDQVLNAELAAASAEARTQTARRRMAEAVAGEILGGFEPDEGTRALLEPLVRRQAGVQAERLVAGSRDAVANVILDALVEGWSVDTTADYMLRVLNEQARWRAVMLARTDLIALGNGAADASVRVLGDAGPQYKTWLTAGDERVRETHVDANRQTVGAQQPFSVGSSLLQYPGDPAGSDEETINCRCTQIFTDSPQPVLRHTFDGGIDDRMAVTAASGWNEAAHPRNPATGADGVDSPGDGGKFKSANPGSADALSWGGDYPISDTARDRASDEEKRRWSKDGVLMYHVGPWAARDSIAQHGLLPGGGGIGGPHPGQTWLPDPVAVYGWEETPGETIARDVAIDSAQQTSEFAENDDELFTVYRIRIPAEHVGRRMGLSDELDPVYMGRVPPSAIEVRNPKTGDWESLVPEEPDSPAARQRRLEARHRAAQAKLRSSAAVLASALSAEELEALVAAFDPAKHPRELKGTKHGGRFRSLREVVENPSEVIELVDEGEHEQLTRLAKEARSKGAEALKERKQMDDPLAVAHASIKHSGMLETARKLEEAAKHAKIQRSLAR